MNTCELCNTHGGEVLVRTPQLRVVLVNDADFPGFCRVIWNAHVREMTDLEPGARAALMDAVWRVEAAVRAVLAPAKINLASLGNVVPHLHWHVIPRWTEDSRFPQPIWVPARADTAFAARPDAAALARLAEHVRQAFEARP